jgi:glycosyltransferase involved in cell wall biosynthesis
MKIALDLTHAAHSSAQTGIQQVARGLAEALQAEVALERIVFDKYADAWRGIDQRERQHLATVDQLAGVKRKRPHWSTWQRIRGRWQRRTGRQPQPPAARFDAIILPEFFAEWVGPRLEELRSWTRGPRAAIFHDAIAFFHHQWGVPETIARYPQYLRELAAVELIGCVSDYSKNQLLEAFAQLQIETSARIETVPLGLRTTHLPRLPDSSPKKEKSALARRRLLSVGTLEPRKNHLTLLAAAEAQWERGHAFELILAGMVNRGSGQPILDEVERLQGKGFPLRWTGALPASELAELYATSTATVFPSACEGFGLPVLESLHFGLPCLASNGGALREVATGPGILASDPTPEAWTAMLRGYLENSDLATRLTEEARTRTVRTMQDYARDWVDLLGEVARS